MLLQKTVATIRHDGGRGCPPADVAALRRSACLASPSHRIAAASSAFGMPSLAQKASTSSTWRAEMFEIKLAALAPGERGALLTEVSSCERESWNDSATPRA